MNDSIFYFEQAKYFFSDLHISKHSRFYSKIGNSYFVRGKFFLKIDKKQKAQNDFEKALEYFEKALEINPLYGKEAADNRNELLDIARNNNMILSDK